MNWLVSTALHLRIIVVRARHRAVIVGLARVCAIRRSMSFPEFATAPWSKFRPKRPASPPPKSKASSPCRLRNALNGTASLKTLRSKSGGRPLVGRAGLSGRHRPDAGAAGRARAAGVGRTAIASRGATAGDLQPLSSTSRAMKIGVSSKTLSQIELTTLARWTIRPPPDGDPRRGELWRSGDSATGSCKCW
jgi:hypothetical protein